MQTGRESNSPHRLQCTLDGGGGGGGGDGDDTESVLRLGRQLHFVLEFKLVIDGPDGFETGLDLLRGLVGAAEDVSIVLVEAA